MILPLDAFHSPRANCPTYVILEVDSKTAGSYLAHSSPLGGAPKLFIKFDPSDISGVPRRKGHGLTLVVHIVCSVDSRPGFTS